MGRELRTTRPEHRGSKLLDSKSNTRNPAPSDHLWQRSLSQIPTVFGRLVYLASLYERNSGKYRNSSLELYLNPEEAERVIRHSHHQVFSKWLAFSLAEQKEDLEQYLTGVGPPSEATRNVTHAYRQAIPAGAREIERQLYLADLETLLELLKAERAAAFGVPEV